MEKNCACTAAGFALPEELAGAVSDCGKAFAGAAERLEFVFKLAADNVKCGGGPFAAAVFRSAAGVLVAAGANRVMPRGQSCFHAELAALANAQSALGKVDLSDCLLVSSCEPCVMCFGAIMWSRIGALVYGMRGSAARAAGFDEGDKVADWERSLMRRGIAVSGPFETRSGMEAFRLYREKGGVIY